MAPAKAEFRSWKCGAGIWSEVLPEEIFSDNLLRMVAAELHLLVGMTAAREMYRKGYFALGVGEKTAVDQAVLQMLTANYQWVTAEMLAAPKTQGPMGFRFPSESNS